jgi:hypothetical protein
LEATMKFLTVALSALTLFAGATPAFAGGDGDGPYGGPPPGPYADAGYGPPPCERCMSPPPPCDCAPVRYEEDVALPTEFFDVTGGVGPDAYALDTGGGGGEIIENSGAEASASASASASVSVSVRGIIREHQRMMRYQPHKSSCGCSSGKKW